MIKKILLWSGIFGACYVLQTTLVPVISIFGAKPDLLIVALFMLAIKEGAMPAVFVGFFLGLAQDVYSPAILGQNALAKTVAGFFASLFNEKVMRIDPVLQAVLLVVTFLLNDIIFMVVQMAKSSGSEKGLLIEIVITTMPRAVYSLVFAAVPFFWELFFQPASRR